MLSYIYTDFASALIKKEFPETKGLQSTIKSTGWPLATWKVVLWKPANEDTPVKLYTETDHLYQLHRKA